MIGGSDAASCLGLHPYQKPIDVFARLVDGVERDSDNEYTRWGNLLEPVIRREFASRNGVSVFVPAESVVVDGWKRATPDGIVLLNDQGEGAVAEVDGPWGLDERFDAGLEVKTGDKWTTDQWGEPGTDDVPVHYAIQAIWYMHVYQAPAWHFAALLGGNNYCEYLMHRDLSLESDIVERVEAFYRGNILERRAPDPDGSESFRRYLRTRWRNVRDEYLPRTATGDYLVEQYRDLVERAATVESELELAKQEICAAIADASGLESEHGRLTWRLQKARKVTDWKGVRQDLIKADVSQALIDAVINVHTKPAGGAEFTRVLRRPQSWTANVK